MCKLPGKQHSVHPLPDFAAVDPVAEWAIDVDQPLEPELPVCPHCARLVQFSRARGLVRCPVCAWQIPLTPDDSFELTKALAGLSDIPANLLLQILVQARTG